MNNYDRHKVTIDKSKEPRKPGISKMIGEGGLGADKYYDIKKKHSGDEEEYDVQDEEK